MQVENEWWSACCGAPEGEFKDIGLCPDCKDHCDWENEEGELASDVENKEGERI